MKTYKALSPIKISSGKVRLDNEQSKSRIKNINPSDNRTKMIESTQDENVFLILGNIEFKKGEKFGWDGERGRLDIEEVSDPLDSDKVTINIALNEKILADAAAAGIEATESPVDQIISGGVAEAVELEAKAKEDIPAFVKSKVKKKGKKK